MTDGNGVSPTSNGHDASAPLSAEWLAQLANSMFRMPAFDPTGVGLGQPAPAPETPLPEASPTVVTDVITAPVIPTMVPHAPVAPPLPTSPETVMDPSAGYYFLTNTPAAAATTQLPWLTAPAEQGAGGPLSAAGSGGDLAAARADFPALNQRVHGRPLIWFDNAATTQKPQVVMDALSHFYANDNSNVHRGAHTLAARATDAYEGARSTVARFLGAAAPEEVVFVRGTTEGLNLIAQSLGKQRVGEGDEIVLTTLEHHANIVPWQMLAKETGAKLRVAGVDNSGQILLDDYNQMLSPKTKIVAISHVSNALGTILPIEQMISMAHRVGAPVVVDGAQAVAHLPVDVTALDADFYVLSGHKIFGPTGIGAVYGKKEWLESMPPWQGGGSMIRDVTFEETAYNDPPYKFEAGTPSIADAVGLRAALEYVMGLGMPRIAGHEQALTGVLMQTLAAIPGVRLIGTAPEKVGVASFVIDGMPNENVGRMLDLEGIAVRSGHHCAQPVLRRFGLEGTVRPSLAFYNTEDEIARFGDAVRDIVRSRH